MRIEISKIDTASNMNSTTRFSYSYFFSELLYCQFFFVEIFFCRAIQTGFLKSN